jgi:hypothetical protein
MNVFKKLKKILQLIVKSNGVDVVDTYYIKQNRSDGSWIDNVKF